MRGGPSGPASRTVRLWLGRWVKSERDLARLADLKNVMRVLIALLTLLSECCGDCLRPLQRWQFRRVPQGRDPPSHAALFAH